MTDIESQIVLSSLKLPHLVRHTTSREPECPSHPRHYQDLLAVAFGYTSSQSLVNQSNEFDSAQSPMAGALLSVHPLRRNTASQIASASNRLNPPSNQHQGSSNILLAPQHDACAALLRAAPASPCCPANGPGAEASARSYSTALEIDSRPPQSKTYAAMLAHGRHGVADVAASSVPSPTTTPAGHEIRRLKAVCAAASCKVMAARRGDTSPRAPQRDPRSPPFPPRCSTGRIPSALDVARPPP
jgi:hypothetical protein